MSDDESLSRELAQLRAEHERLQGEHAQLLAASASRVTQTDLLTGLPSRMLLLDRLNQTLARARRNQQAVAVFSLDLDRFKLINETLGLSAGDEVIRAIADRLRTFIREYDTLARIGGDEFCLMLSDLADVQDAVKVAERIIDAMTVPVCVADHELFVGASIGISIFPHDGSDPATLLKNAEAAMFRAKAQGSAAELYAPAMNASFAERLALENSLRRGLQRGEFLLHYQPQYSAATGELIGAEALVRWQHPDLGLVSPLKFIPLAEETGLITPLTAWVMRTACEQARKWLELGFEGKRMAVNLSGHCLRHPDLIERVSGILQETGLPASSLEIELTESVLMEDVEGTVRLLKTLSGQGIHFALDDFGTGFSSLSYLTRFPFQTLKIDRSFLLGVPGNGNSVAIVRAIIALAQSLGHRVVAEGVETEDQLAFLRQEGCDAVQGYYYSRPLPAQEFGDLLAAHASARPS